MMKTQIKGFGFKDLFRSTSFVGWILLARPVLYFLFSRRRELNAYATVDSTAVIFILYSFFAIAAGFKTLFLGKHNFGKLVMTRTSMVWFILYSILCAASMMWSVDPILTGFRAFECVAMMLLIVAVIQQLFETRNLEYVILWSLFYCLWDMTFDLIRTARWANSIWQFLESSQMMSTTFFFMALYYVPRRWYNYVILIMSIFSMSTVAYIGMALGAVSAFWTRGKTKIITIFCSFAILMAALLVGPYTLIKNTIFFDKNDISLEETNGRDKLLNLTIASIKEYPFGLGFFAAEPYLIYATGQHAISAHNSLLSAGMGMGFPGIILFSIFLFSMGKSVFSRYIPHRYKPIMIGCFCVALMHCMGNPSVGTRVYYGAWMPGMYVFVLICSFNAFGRFYKNTLSPTRTIS